MQVAELSDVKSYAFRFVIEQDKIPDGSSVVHAYALGGPGTRGCGPGQALANTRKPVELYLADLNDVCELVLLDAVQGMIKLEAPAVAANA